MKFNKRANRNHNYTNLVHEQDFFLEVSPESDTGSIVNITGQGNVKVGDTITIQLQVVEVEHYSDSPDIWRAKLSM
jgi:MOSC domain-containing protein YiiM